jgi:hypothetical protein
VDHAHQTLLVEIRRRLEEARADRGITNTGGSNYWGPYVTRAVDKREDDGPALVEYIKDVLRKSGNSDGWNALLEADRLDISFEDMVVNATDPIKGLFNDEDRAIAAQSLGDQRAEIERRAAEAQAGELERDHRVLAQMDEVRLKDGKSELTDEQRADVLSARAARRRRAAG